MNAETAVADNRVSDSGTGTILLDEHVESTMSAFVLAIENQANKNQEDNIEDEVYRDYIVSELRKRLELDRPRPRTELSKVYLKALMWFLILFVLTICGGLIMSAFEGDNWDSDTQTYRTYMIDFIEPLLDHAEVTVSHNSSLHFREAFYEITGLNGKRFGINLTDEDVLYLPYSTKH